MAFRECFHLACRSDMNWMPFHFNSILQKIQEKLKNIDCILQMHDARVPISGRNFRFQYNITNKCVKPHILLLNKKDLTDTCDHGGIRSQLRRALDRHIIFTCAKHTNDPGVGLIVPLVTKLVTDADQNSRNNKKEYNIMLIGAPKVGKKTLISSLTSKYLPVGDSRTKSDRLRLQTKPTIYLYRQPINLHPCILDNEAGMKLILTGGLSHKYVDDEILADFLLYWLNKHNYFSYVKYMGLNKPCDDITKVLTTYASKHRLCERIKHANGKIETIFDLKAAAKKFLFYFRTGELGAFNLDQSLLAMC